MKDDGIKAILQLLPSVEGWTDEQWAEHDRAVAAQREAETAPPRPSLGSVSNRMIADGWPRRAVAASEQADEGAGAVPEIRRWKTDERNILLLSGQVGCGKTVAAAWWARQQRCPVLFVRASTFAASSRYDRDERERILAAPALVFDDLGSEYLDAKGSFTVDMEELVDRFHGDERPLIVTTNCVGEQFRQRYGERIADRIRECGRWISLTGTSMRRRG